MPEISKQEWMQQEHQSEQAWIDFAYRSIPERYHHYIELISQRKRFGQTNEYLTVYIPYLNVNGRLAMATDEHRSKGWLLDVLPSTWEEITSFLIVKITVKSSALGQGSGSARVNLEATSGAEKSNPIETAETSALGRALKCLGYGLILEPLNESTTVNMIVRDDDIAEALLSNSETYRPSGNMVESSRPASESEIEELTNTLLHIGIKEEYIRPLIEFKYPNGITYNDVQKTMEMNADNLVHKTWFAPYVKLVREQHGVESGALVAFTEHTFGQSSPLNLSHLQQLELIDWIMEFNSDPIDWDGLIDEIYKNCDDYLKGDITWWLLKVFSNKKFDKDNLPDITELPNEAYSMVKSMSIDDIKKDLDAVVGSGASEKEAP